MDFTSRDEARSLGEKYYFLGDQCSKGHIAERLVSSNACLECIEDRNEEFLFDKTNAVERKLEKKKVAKDSLEYARSVIEFLRETADPDSPESVKLLEMELDILPKTREIAVYLGEKFYYTGYACEAKGHLSKRITKYGICFQCTDEYSSWYRSVYKEEISAYHQNRRARIKEVGGTFEAKDIANMYSTQNALCNSCWEPLEVLGYHIDHVMPISKGGTNWPDNLQLLCPECNLQKSAKLPEEWEKIALVKRKGSVKWKTMKMM